jgi:hypothetical protein
MSLSDGTRRRLDLSMVGRSASTDGASGRQRTIEQAVGAIDRGSPARRRPGRRRVHATGHGSDGARRAARRPAATANTAQERKVGRTSPISTQASLAPEQSCNSKSWAPLRDLSARRAAGTNPKLSRCGLCIFGNERTGPTPIWWTVDVLGSGYSI